MNGSHLLPNQVQTFRLLIAPTAVAATVLLLATPALAQQARPGEQLGMRYLSWAGKPPTTAGDGLRRTTDVTPRTQVASVAAPSVTTPSVAASGRPNRYGAAMSGGNGLTPASVWTGQPAPMPTRQAEQPAPRQMPQPMRTPAGEPSQAQTAAGAPEYDPGRSFRRQDPYYAAPPQVQAAMQPTPQPTYMPPPPVIPAAVEAAADPMTPRPDAMIFRMGRPASASADTAQASPQPMQQGLQQPPQQAPAPRQMAQAAPSHAGGPPREGARYYSVHREAGHEPDPLTLPDSVFVGGGTTDLAEPPAAVITPRTVNGRAQVVIPNQDPALP